MLSIHQNKTHFNKLYSLQGAFEINSHLILMIQISLYTRQKLHILKIFTSCELKKEFTSTAWLAPKSNTTFFWNEFPCTCVPQRTSNKHKYQTDAVACNTHERKHEPCQSKSCKLLKKQHRVS